MKQRDRFLHCADVLVRESGVTVRKYRTRSSGAAYSESDDWGIEAPKPVGAISFAIFAHEVGHQMMHREGRRARWLEEIEAWEFALAQFDRFDLPGVERVHSHAAKHLRMMAGRAARRHCTAATARAIVERYPKWAWEFDDPRDAVTTDVFALFTLAGRVV